MAYTDRPDTTWLASTLPGQPSNRWSLADLQHPQPPVRIFDEQGSELPVGEDYSFTYYPQEHGLLIAVWTEDGRDVASLIRFTDLNGHVLDLREIPGQPLAS